MPFTNIATGIPAMFRRAAINAALGATQSFYSNLAKWHSEKEKFETKQAAKVINPRNKHKLPKKFKPRPPVPPRYWNKSPVFYAGYYKERTERDIVLKLWDDKTWRWVKFQYAGSNNNLATLSEDWEIGSPQLVNHSKTNKTDNWWLHFPIERKVTSPGKVEKQVKANPELRVCSVDLNINEALAVCTVVTADGKVHASRFIRGGKALQRRRKRLLGRIARNRSRTGIIQQGIQDNKALWRRIRNLDEATAQKSSRWIVDFAASNGASVVVFEHLANVGPQRDSNGKRRYSRRGNEKRSYWLRGKIFNFSKYKAWIGGDKEQTDDGNTATSATAILTSRVNPRNTSKECHCCGNLVARYNTNTGFTVAETTGEPSYRPGAPLFHCPVCQAKGNADHNAARNIGKRLFSRYSAAALPTNGRAA